MEKIPEELQRGMEHAARHQPVLDVEISASNLGTHFKDVSCRELCNLLLIPRKMETGFNLFFN